MTSWLTLALNIQTIYQYDLKFLSENLPDSLMIASWLKLAVKTMNIIE